MRYTIGKAIKKRDVEYKYFRAYEGSAPEYMLVSRHHYKNFFEIPFLFYLLCLVLYSINDVSTIDLWIAWLFVIFKFGHSYIRMTSNYVPYRAYSFYGCVIFLTTSFIPFLPSGAFFADYNLTIFWINLSIMYSVNKKTNIFTIDNNYT